MQRGFALPELLVGLALGLFIVAAAAFAAASSLDNQRRVRLEAQLQQDLRAAADLMSRELRRAGHWESAADGAWADGAGIVAANPYAELLALPKCTSTQGVAFEDGLTACGVLFTYDRAGTPASAKQLGFRLRNDAIEMHFGNSGWQAVTEPALVKITRLDITLRRHALQRDAWCAAPCPPDRPLCGPTQELRDLEFAITGRSVADAKVERTLTANVRLRNDVPNGSCP